MRGNHKESIRTIVVEDEAKIGVYIKNKIEYLDSDFSVAAVAENGKQALEIIGKYRPHVVFTDISMPVMDGLELSRLIRNSYPNIIVVIISGYSDFTYAQKAVRYGVFNYILKPLEDDKLSDALHDIKKNLLQAKMKPGRHILYSDVYMIQQTPEIRYVILSLCVGNLFYDIQDGELTEYYQREMKKIPWREIMEELVQGKYDWYLSDEYVPNQKIAGIQIRQGDRNTPEDFAKRLRDLLKPYTDLAVHIALSEKTLDYESVWNITKHLRYLMRNELIVGKSQILTTEKEKRDSRDIQEIVKIKLSSYIRDYFISTDLKNFSGEIQTILKYMMRNGATQQDIEKVSLYVLKLLEFSGKDYELEFLEDMQEKLQRDIGLSATVEELHVRMMEDFKEIESYMEQLYEKRTESRIMEYVDNNFLSLEGLEQVADVFGYNYAYLSRLFKEKSGMSMNRYITGKKIEMAKKLLEENPDMLLEEVSVMCGYNDSRYFSRVFKGQVGMTPSEYRNR